MAGTKAKGSKKNRKFSNNKIFCERYFKENRRLINKTIKLKRHIKNHPNDIQSVKALSNIV